MENLLGVNQPFSQGSPRSGSPVHPNDTAIPQPHHKWRGQVPLPRVGQGSARPCRRGRWRGCWRTPRVRHLHKCDAGCIGDVDRFCRHLLIPHQLLLTSGAPLPIEEYVPMTHVQPFPDVDMPQQREGFPQPRLWGKDDYSLSPDSPVVLQGGGVGVSGGVGASNGERQHGNENPAPFQPSRTLQTASRRTWLPEPETKQGKQIDPRAHRGTDGQFAEAAAGCLPRQRPIQADGEEPAEARQRHHPCPPCPPTAEYPQPQQHLARDHQQKPPRRPEAASCRRLGCQLMPLQGRRPEQHHPDHQRYTAKAKARPLLTGDGGGWLFRNQRGLLHAHPARFLIPR